MWEQEGVQTALLVTSAFHMPRAMATFQRAGLPVTASTAGAHTIQRIGFFTLMPDSDALDTSTIAMKEWIGILVYRLWGWA